MHRDLRLAGLLAPLDCPHHLRFEDKSPYREGVCVEEPHWSRHNTSSSSSSAAAAACWVDVGLRDPVFCPLPASSVGVPVGARVTVKMPAGGGGGGGQDRRGGKLVSPREPVEQRGLYWGYTVRLSSSLSEAISGSSFNEPYDFVVGTSERGTSLDELVEQVAQNDNAGSGGIPSSFSRALIVFGGLSGLEVAVERDENINATADEASQLFDAWVNVVENQGSRTIRTEEALFIALARLKSIIERLGARS